MSDDILLIGDGEFNIEASAPEGRKPRIRCAPAYSGGKLDVAWKNPETGEHLPVVVDIATLKTEEGLPFVRHHNGTEPLGTIEKITKTNSELCAEGSFTHGHTHYGATELIAARNGFKHRPSVTVYRPDPKDVIRVGAGEKRFINDRYHEGAYFAIYNGRLKDISLVTTPGDPDGGKGAILAQSQGVQTMSEPNLLPDPPEPAIATPPAPPATSPLEIQATANPTPPAPPVTPAVNVVPSVPSDHREQISKMYERGDLSVDIMAQAYDQNWSPKQ